MPHGEITGFVLAGGRSRRMGRNKSELTWGTQTFLTHAIARMQQVCDRVLLVGGSAEASVPVLEDAFPGEGPLAGLHTALLHSTTEWNLILAIDMPLVSSELLKFITSRCVASALAVVPTVASSASTDKENTPELPSGNADPILQPLCAAYHRRFLPFAEQALSAGQLSIRRLLEQGSQGIMTGQGDVIRIIDQYELTAAGFAVEMLMNVNTPADLERAKGLAERFHVK